MDTSILAALLAVVICVTGVAGQRGGTGLHCNDRSYGLCSDEVNDMCQLNLCKVQVGKSCAYEKERHCVKGARCGTGNLCECITPNYIRNTNDPRICMPAPTYVRGVCVGSGGVDNCQDVHAECVEGLCRCQGEWFWNMEDNTCMEGPVQDYEGSASSVMLSTTSLLSALFVTSHFL